MRERFWTWVLAKAIDCRLPVWVSNFLSRRMCAAIGRRVQHGHH